MEDQDDNSLNVATLELSMSAGWIKFRVLELEKSYRGAKKSLASQLAKELDEQEHAGTAHRTQLLRRYVDAFVPAEFATWFRTWSSSPDKDSVLCVHTDDPMLSSLPWTELLTPPDVAPTRSWIVRVCHSPDEDAPGAPAALTRPVELLLAGWSKLTGQPMLGIERELQQFKQKFGPDRFNATILADANRSAFLSACETGKAGIVHLSPPSFAGEDSDLGIPVTADDEKRHPDAAKFELVKLAVLTQSLKKNERLRMVLVNACNAGLVGCENISRALGVVALGWPALVSDDTAADFTFYFYQRLIEGLTPVAAVRSFAQTVWKRESLIEFPVLWFPSAEWLPWRPLAEKAAAPAPRVHERRGKEPQPDTSSATPGLTPKQHPVMTATTARLPGVHMEFRPRPAINPALLVNGLHPIEHLSIDSSEEQTVHLCITCDTGGGNSMHRQTVSLKQGTNPVRVEEIHFPALHELIERQAHRRRVSFTATILDCNKNELYGETRTAIWMGAKEWLDQEETWAFVPAFVNPFDEGVLQVFEAATKVLRTIGSPGDAFTGYNPTPGDVSPVANQIRAIYQTLRDEANGITYISPPGSPLFDGNSKRSVGQVIRTHSEVVGRRLGTCHDLALLLAACAEYVGIRPLIVLLPAHTIVGYWTDKHHQEDYWKPRGSKLLTGKVGENWTISRREELQKLIEEKKIELIEATYLSRKDKTFFDACKAGLERLGVGAMAMEVAIDIYAARRDIQPV